MDLTVVVGTCGTKEWSDLAHERAIPSVPSGVSVIHHHGLTVVGARNEALAGVQTEWVVHLDADDELEPGYVEAMERGTADVRGPMARYIRGRSENLWQPRVAGHHHDCTAECLPAGNFVLVGAAVRTEIIRRAGGWRDYPWSEDWSTWIRCWKAGATFELIRDAVYRAHVNPQSRNRGASREVRDAAHWQIHRDEFPELYAEAA